MKEFDYFMQSQVIQKIEPDLELAKLLLFDVKARLEISAELSLNEKNSRVIFELVCDSLIKLVKIILLCDGYYTSSDEAAITYLHKFQEFSSIEILELEKFRRISFHSKYEGKPASLQDALEIRRIFPKIKDRLIKKIRERMM